MRRAGLAAVGEPVVGQGQPGAGAKVRPSILGERARRDPPASLSEIVVVPGAGGQVPALADPRAGVEPELAGAVLGRAGLPDSEAALMLAHIGEDVDRAP